MEERRMKKLSKILVMLVMTIMCVVVMSNIALASGAKLEGVSEVREGDKLEVTVVIPDAGQYRVEGMFSYDENNFVLEAIELKMENWMVEIEGDKFVATDETKANPTSENSAIITATFSIKSSVKPGDLVKLSVENLKSNDGITEKRYDTLTHKITMRSPISTNNALYELIVTDYNLIPEFNKDVMEYSIGEVDFTVRDLEISANPEDYQAVVTIENNTSLKVGDNLIKINVQAEDGSVRTYTISANRKVNEEPKEEIKDESNESEDKVNQDKDSDKEAEDKDTGLPGWMIVVFVLVGVAIGGVICYFVIRKMKNMA